jgi:hypothetical protein
LVRCFNRRQPSPWKTKGEPNGVNFLRLFLRSNADSREKAHKLPKEGFGNTLRHVGPTRQFGFGRLANVVAGGMVI